MFETPEGINLPTPLAQDDLKDIFTRAFIPAQSTLFRFIDNPYRMVVKVAVVGAQKVRAIY
jgi:hypothetical protein